MKLLFLDIDGVLNGHERWANRWSGMRPDLVQILNRVLLQCPDVQIVLSSAWRYRFCDPWSAEGVLCVFGVEALERFHGLTDQDPVVEDRPSFDDVAWWEAVGLRWRKEQIERYVAAARPTAYAVLDDLPLDVQHLFQTDPKVGITEALADRLIAHFGAERVGGGSANGR